MSLTQSAERAALNKLIDYLDDNPQENIDKIMDLVNKLVPDRVFPAQREAFTNVIKSRGNWYDLIMRVFTLNPDMRTKLLKALIVDGNLLAWPQQEKNREMYQCNIPPGHRFRRNECCGRYQSHADHLLRYGSVSGGRHCSFLRCAGQRSVRIYLCKK